MSIVYYVNNNNDYYIDNNNNNYIYAQSFNGKKEIPYIYKNGAFKRVRPVIIKTTNMGKIPSNALVLNDGATPFLTNTKEYLLVDPSTTGLTAESTYDYILYEYPRYVAYIM